MKILLLAGEESGVLYANRLRALLAGDEIRGFEDYGFRTADLAVMGLGAVLRRLPYFMRVKRTMERVMDEWRPDALITIDYPGMNMRLAAYAKARGIRTVHVVCPQVWAWKKGRIPRIEAAFDRLCCFFPFEPQYFKPGFAEFIGHPLAEDFPAVAEGREIEKNLVAILPGSRINEIERNLPPLLDALAQLPATMRASIPAAHELAKAAIDKVLKSSGAALLPRVEVTLGGARELLLRADCAAVASGTATLEATLARCPTVLVYRVSAAFAWFLRRVIKEIRHVGLANVIWEKTGEIGEEPMPELLQENFTADAVAAHLREWLEDPAARERAVSRLDAIARKVAVSGNSLSRVVSAIKE